MSHTIPNRSTLEPEWCDMPVPVYGKVILVVETERLPNNSTNNTIRLSFEKNSPLIILSSRRVQQNDFRSFLSRPYCVKMNVNGTIQELQNNLTLSKELLQYVNTVQVWVLYNTNHRFRPILITNPRIADSYYFRQNLDLDNTVVLLKYTVCRSRYTCVLVLYCTVARSSMYIDKC